MNDITGSLISVRNRILDELPVTELKRMFAKFEHVELKYDQLLFRGGDTIKYIYFPNSGIISLLSTVSKTSMIEVGLIGREGLVGLTTYLGVTTATNTAMVQGGGTAMRMKSSDFLKICDKRGALPKVLRRFAQSRISQISQLAACYRFHQTEARLARWLLMTADRMETLEFEITQEFLSNMLGVRREAVNKTAVALQELGLIGHSRGHISIIDRKGLEKESCSCYQIMKDESARV